jgi:hypothetical protein
MNEKPSRLYEYVITQHARERYVEKLGPNSNRYKHLIECGKGCRKCHDLLWRQRDEVHLNRSTLNKVITARLFKAKPIEIDADSDFFVKMARRYPGKALSYLHQDDAIFVIVTGREGGEAQKVCVTCYESNHSIFTGYIHRRVLIPLELLTEDLLEHVRLAEAAFHKRIA